jgi:hypothetical protein
MSIPSRSEPKGHTRHDGECGADLLFFALVSLFAGLFAFVIHYAR